MDQLPRDRFQGMSLSSGSSESRKPDAATLEIVRAHRGMMWLFMGKFAIEFWFALAREEASSAVRLMMGIAVAAAYVGLAVCVFRLTRLMYGTVWGIICTLLTAMPCLDLLAVLIIHGNIKDRLQKSGIKVGFLGASRRQLAELEKTKG